LKSIVFVLACAFGSSALADERAAQNVPASHAEEPGRVTVDVSRPLEDEQLAKLRGRLATPADLQQAGVVLWDEPRKGLPPPPVRTSGEPPSASSVSTSFTIHVK
jgi:hypothetical protein